MYTPCLTCSSWVIADIFTMSEERTNVSYNDIQRLIEVVNFSNFLQTCSQTRYQHKLRTVQVNSCTGKHFLYCISVTEVSRRNRVEPCMRSSLFNVYLKCGRHNSRVAHSYNYMTCMWAPIVQYTLKTTAPFSHYCHTRSSNFIFRFAYTEQ